MPTQAYRTRFAPSPTGFLHVGHAYAVMQLEQWATKHDGEILLRIEDIDATRCRPQWIPAIQQDLKHLGFEWHGDIHQQSQHLKSYQQAIQHLRDMNVIYPCFCTRKKIKNAVQSQIKTQTQMSSIDLFDAYPQTCRHLNTQEQQKRMSSERFAWRLNCEKAAAIIHQPIQWAEQTKIHTVNIQHIGDVILARKDIGTSYHIAVVVDDAIQGITHVIRGDDLSSSTPVHVLLQKLLGLPTPIYQHHALLCHRDGQRLAKSQQSIHLRHLFEAGLSSQSLRDFLHHCDGVWSFPADTSAKYITQQLGS
ncbi:MAG: tRNA glutamyl-Q(34) synthetase GluQRS [Mariprofundaceae bacterium]|nr:tRNA glutamyl-Q(34) synthetase GluQRS [Mariprofundaceae bacterium]